MGKKRREVAARAHKFDLQRACKEAEKAEKSRRKVNANRGLKKKAKRRNRFRYRRGMYINGVKPRNKGHALELIKQKRARAEFCEPADAPPRKKRMVEKMVARAVQDLGGLDLKAGDSAFVMGAVNELTDLKL